MPHNESLPTRKEEDNKGANHTGVYQKKASHQGARQEEMSREAVNQRGVIQDQSESGSKRSQRNVSEHSESGRMSTATMARMNPSLPLYNPTLPNGIPRHGSRSVSNRYAYCIKRCLPFVCASAIMTCSVRAACALTGGHEMHCHIRSMSPSGATSAAQLLLCF